MAKEKNPNPETRRAFSRLAPGPRGGAAASWWLGWPWWLEKGKRCHFGSRRTGSSLECPGRAPLCSFMEEVLLTVGDVVIHCHRDTNRGLLLLPLETVGAIGSVSLAPPPPPTEDGWSWRRPRSPSRTPSLEPDYSRSSRGSRSRSRAPSPSTPEAPAAPALVAPLDTEPRRAGKGNSKGRRRRGGQRVRARKAAAAARDSRPPAPAPSPSNPPVTAFSRGRVPRSPNPFAGTPGPTPFAQPAAASPFAAAARLTQPVPASLPPWLGCRTSHL